ncbi:MAG: LytTR family DNA-binding domain-containing protein [Arcicella sp.]|jgi:DNA-binding LytR/AlgR family response regulator|nr:LytTR family DNA-binding domain-containing protein [Arcicella sp.]
MIKVVIIEDERHAARFLNDLLATVAPDVEVVAMFENIAESVEKLPILNPDLVLADIQLEDGVSFSIFEKLKWKKPVIFITAYDTYAIRAFKVNGIDYLLKPCDEEELKLALEKYRSNKANDTTTNLQDAISLLINHNKETYKERFAIVIGTRIHSIPIAEIAYFYFANKSTYLVKTDGKKFPYSESMDSLYHLLNPAHFFRINRNYILQHQAIDRIEQYAGRNITVTLKPLPAEGSIVVSKDRISEFKGWLDK